MIRKTKNLLSMTKRHTIIESPSQFIKEHTLYSAVILFILLFASSLQAQSSNLDKILASDGGSDDDFGRSVSISGDHLAIGAYGDNENGYGIDKSMLFRWGSTLNGKL